MIENGDIATQVRCRKQKQHAMVFYRCCSFRHSCSRNQSRNHLASDAMFCRSDEFHGNALEASISCQKLAASAKHLSELTHKEEATRADKVIMQERTLIQNSLAKERLMICNTQGLNDGNKDMICSKLWCLTVPAIPSVHAKPSVHAVTA